MVGCPAPIGACGSLRRSGRTGQRPGSEASTCGNGGKGSSTGSPAVAVDVDADLTVTSEPPSAPDAFTVVYTVVDGFLVPEGAALPLDGPGARPAGGRGGVAGGGPPPAMDPDPDTARWRDLLDEMIVGGEAERFLSPDGFRRARGLLSASPLDCEALRSAVHTILDRDRAGRYAALGIQADCKVWSAENRGRECGE